MQTFLDSFVSVRQVRDYCEKRDLKGKQCDARHCIVVELIRQEFPDLSGKDVAVKTATFGTGIIDVGGDEYVLPEIMNRFAIDFDSGKYPELLL